MPAPPAPGELDLVRRFVNTGDIDAGEDEIDTVAGLQAWLRAEGLPGVATADSAGVALARGLREALRALLLANNGEELDPGAAAALADAGAAAPLRVAFDPAGVAKLQPAATGVAAALGQILAVVAQAQADGTWARLKACSADDCRWAFYDHSRNRSRTWCSMEVCGNRAKARSYRARGGGS
jgi:predicted RNA-binding Zn ribbon-like protein